MKFRPKIPPVSGWLEVELGQNEIDHLWKCIDTEGKDVKSSLVGNISKSFEIKDIDNIFYVSINSIKHFQMELHSVVILTLIFTILF